MVSSTPLPLTSPSILPTMIRSSPDGDGAPLPYPDSEVGSSPRSIGAAGSRTASLTEEPPSSIKWDDIKVRLMCSYGGRILPRPQDNQLRYVGGESRIVVVNRNVTFAELKSKLFKTFGANLVVKYQLPYEDLDALISVTSDEDLENMMEEYDRLQSTGNRPSSVRLRLFLFPLKLERSQTSSIIEMMDHTRGSENMFVDILNSMPALPRVRSEASSYLSESPDHLVQGSMDALEEWAAATSYSNSCLPPQAEQPSEAKEPNVIPAVALFGSLLQNPGSGEITSTPGSPSPIKPMPFSTGPFSSAPPVVIWPTLTQQVVADIDPSFVASQDGVGSDDLSGSVHEEKMHVDGQISLTSENSILNSSLGAAEQLFLPAGLMDDDDFTQKSSARGSLEEAVAKSQSLNSDVGVHQAAASGSLKNVDLGIPASVGQPVFNEKALPEHDLVQSLKVLHNEDTSSTPPSGIPSTLAQIQPLSSTPQVHVLVATTKHQFVPSPPQTVAQSSGEDNIMQQDHRVLAHMAVSKSVGEDCYSPSLSHFLSPLVSPEEATSIASSRKLSEEDSLSVQVRGVGNPQDVVSAETETSVHVQPPSVGGTPPGAIPMVSPPIHQPVIQKVVAAPVPNYLYHQYMQQHSPKATTSATTYATRAPGNQFPNLFQTPSPLINEAVLPSTKALMGSPASNIPHPVLGISRPYSAQSITPSEGVFQPPFQLIQTTNSPASGAPIMAPSVGEAGKKISPTVPSVTPTTVISSVAEGIKGIPSVPSRQLEAAQLQRKVSDPYGQRAISPSQYVAANLSGQAALGLPSRFQAVGRPIQQVAEGIPVQQSPVVVTVSDKKGAVPVQRAVLDSYRRPAVISDSPSGYYMVEQSNAAAQPTTLLGGMTQYNVTSNIKGAAVSSPDTVPSLGANPYVGTFQPAPQYQDARGVPPTEQQQRPQMWP